MKQPDPQYALTELSELERLFEPVKEASLLKELDHVDANYAEWIAAAPFFALATLGPRGLDCSPRGDAPGFVHVLDPKTLLIPDRRGNNRIDSLLWRLGGSILRNEERGAETPALQGGAARFRSSALDFRATSASRHRPR